LIVPKPAGRMPVLLWAFSKVGEGGVSETEGFDNNGILNIVSVNSGHILCLNVSYFAALGQDCR
jgi:hypothetical protein